MKYLQSLAFAGLCLVSTIEADMYLHNPRGSNNKLNEQSNTVTNNNRLFDSQNNDNAGYQVGDACVPFCQSNDNNNNQNYDPNNPGAGQGIMQFYEGSELAVDWTNQHGCGANPEVKCNIVLQYACEDDKYFSGVRDGKVVTRIPLTPNDPNIGTYGQHENFDWYTACTTRARNTGLYTADQNLQGTTAQFTRQNSNGARSGLECPEERDYYPYWHYSPWRDIFVCTDDQFRCPYYQRESQNVNDKGACSDMQYNNAASCIAANQVWTESGNFGIDPPVCGVCPTTRNNHNGNAQTAGAIGQSSGYTWTLPVGQHADGAKCILRIRYNISTTDFDGWKIDKLYNGGNTPLGTNPTKDFVGFGTNVTGPLRLAVNTAQFPRTFEDRTHVFQIRKLPAGAKGLLQNSRIINLNVRGRRGNIVQVYPAVELDFIPNPVVASRGDVLHIQWTGSDANDQNNNGNGRQGTDRANLVMMGSLASNTPVNMNPTSPAQAPTFFTNNISAIVYMAYLNQTGCDQTTADQNSRQNCKVLNRAPAYINVGLVPLDNVGTFNFMNSRQNQFSNRENKGTIVVTENYAAAATAVGATGGFLAFGAFALFLCFGYAKRHPESKLSYLLKTRGVVAAGEFDDEEADIAVAEENKVVPLGERYPLIGKFQAWYEWEKSRVIFASVYVVANVAVWLYGYLSNMGPGHDPLFAYAKGFGKTLDVNIGFILIPVLRNFLSFIRTTSAADYLPLDDNINIHIMSAVFVALGAFGHIACHYYDFWWESMNLGVPIQNNALWTLPGFTGHFIFLFMFIMFVTASIKRNITTIFGRRFDGYRIFIAVHKLWMPSMAFLIFHSANIWPFLLWPLAFMALEKFIQGRRKRLDVLIVEAKIAGRDVLSLKMRLSNKKNKFRYKAGQYLFLQCPDVSDEWHPFTITSAPEESFFSCHIRCRSDMDWTFRLRRRIGFAESVDDFGRPTPPRTTPVTEADSATSPLMKVDGPYGSASEEVFDHNVVVLVGAGIGVTPFISILKSISIRMKGKTDKELENLTIYFYWICRDQNEFNSFKDLFDEVMSNKFLASKVEINSYTTGEMDLKTVKIENYNQFAGKPSWNRILKDKGVKHEGETVGVFLCGPAAIAAELSMACKKNSTSARKSTSPNGGSGTHFKFYKENF